MEIFSRICNNYKFKTRSVFSILFLSYTFSFSQSGDTLRVTLEQAKAYAKLHSSDMKQNALEVDRAKLIVKQAVAALLPQVSGDASYTYYTKVPTNAIPANTFSSGLDNTFGPLIAQINQLNSANGLPPYVPVQAGSDDI